jgi:3-dehydroquinate dehydratase II
MAGEPQAVRLEVLHGPNLNLLGEREPDVYGHLTLDEVDAAIRAEATDLGIEVGVFQSNHEGALIERIHDTAAHAAGFVVNAAGYSHTSVALRDALVAAGRPFVEVHMSNVWARERFRQKSLLAPVALGTVGGFGARSYTLALRGLAGHLEPSRGGIRGEST